MITGRPKTALALTADEQTQLQSLATSLSDHPKPASDYHLKTGQRE